MKDTRTFPDGYELNIVRRSDILNELRDTVTDFDVVMEVVTHCEKEVGQRLLKGEWAGLPFMGNFKINEVTQINKTEERRELYKDMKKELTKEEFRSFRKDLALSDNIQIEREKRYNREATVAANVNLKRYRKLCTTVGIAFAKFKIWAEARSYIVESNELIYD